MCGHQASFKAFAVYFPCDLGFRRILHVAETLTLTVDFHHPKVNMADPLSILGAGLGVTSLILQVMDECVKGTMRRQTS